MPSIQDVADQINARLDQVSTSTAQTAQNTADNLVVSQQIRDELSQVNSRLSQIDNTLVNGFANLSQGLFAILEVQLSALNLLEHHRRQNDAIICELVNNNDLLCNIANKLARQVRLSESINISTLRIEGIAERAHYDAAGDYDRNLELHKKLEVCCPPDPIAPEKCPDACSVPKYRDRKPKGQDWKPMPTPQKPTPEG